MSNLTLLAGLQTHEFGDFARYRVRSARSEIRGTGTKLKNRETSSTRVDFRVRLALVLGAAWVLLLFVMLANYRTDKQNHIDKAHTEAKAAAEKVSARVEENLAQYRKELLFTGANAALVGSITESAGACRRDAERLERDGAAVKRQPRHDRRELPDRLGFGIGRQQRRRSGVRTRGAARRVRARTCPLYIRQTRAAVGSLGRRRGRMAERVFSNRL